MKIKPTHLLFGVAILWFFTRNRNQTPPTNSGSFKTWYTADQLNAWLKQNRITVQDALVLTLQMQGKAADPTALHNANNKIAMFA